jgi:hypothetical protein
MLVISAATSGVGCYLDFPAEDVLVSQSDAELPDGLDAAMPDSDQSSVEADLVDGPDSVLDDLPVNDDAPAQDDGPLDGFVDDGSEQGIVDLIADGQASLDATADGKVDLALVADQAAEIALSDAPQPIDLPIPPADLSPDVSPPDSFQPDTTPPCSGWAEWSCNSAGAAGAGEATCAGNLAWRITCSVPLPGTHRVCGCYYNNAFVCEVSNLVTTPACPTLAQQVFNTCCHP